MPDATLLDVYAAVFDAVASLGTNADGSGLFKSVVEFGGELTQETIAQVTETRLPAALVALDAEEPNASVSFDTTTREMASIVRVSLTVYLVVETTRGSPLAYRGTDDTPGLLALQGAVMGAVNGLELSGLWGSARVHCQGTRPVTGLWRPGNTGALAVLAMRFYADRSAEQVCLTAETDPFEQFDGEVNPLDANATTDADALPLSTVRAEDLHD